MTVTFSEMMDTNFSKPFLNETFINITAIPAELGEEYEPEIRNLNLTWKVKNFTGRELNISLKFEFPEIISKYHQEKLRDRIMFQAESSSMIFKSINLKPVNTTESLRICP